MHINCKYFSWTHASHINWKAQHLKAKYTSSNIFNKNNVKSNFFLIFENDALLINGKRKRRKEENISGVILVVFTIEKFLIKYTN